MPAGADDGARRVGVDGTSTRATAGAVGGRRRLGKALDCDPMQLYRYASSKDALLDGVVELVLSRLDVPPAAGGDWAQVLRRTGHAFRELALAHPNVVPLVVTRPLATPLALRPLGTLRPLDREMPDGSDVRPVVLARPAVAPPREESCGTQRHRREAVAR